MPRGYIILCLQSKTLSSNRAITVIHHLKFRCGETELSIFHTLWTYLVLWLRWNPAQATSALHPWGEEKAQQKPISVKVHTVEVHCNANSAQRKWQEAPRAGKPHMQAHPLMTGNYLHYPIIVRPQAKKQEGNTIPHPSTENWIKDLLSIALPIRTIPRFPLSHSLLLGSFRSLLSLYIRGQTEWKPQPQKTKQTAHMDHSLV